ncbi:hypothetical protein D9756_010692 [Leucocoprinus leucothites]|uniref:Uncharacterized protein n=1 Tax=Leucocoprinus leucothites TaxID=201217 RepID=A0A8H5CV05_9AGAR|nr:hypothetical protein D9756_010692 [Leucoagaricus leucothites]
MSEARILNHFLSASYEFQTNRVGPRTHVWNIAYRSVIRDIVSEIFLLRDFHSEIPKAFRVFLPYKRINITRISLMTPQGSKYWSPPFGQPAPFERY